MNGMPRGIEQFVFVREASVRTVIYRVRESWVSAGTLRTYLSFLILLQNAQFR